MATTTIQPKTYDTKGWTPEQISLDRLAHSHFGPILFWRQTVSWGPSQELAAKNELTRPETLHWIVESGTPDHFTKLAVIKNKSTWLKTVRLLENDPDKEVSEAVWKRIRAEPPKREATSENAADVGTSH
jgi:hypothetical protein